MLRIPKRPVLVRHYAWITAIFIPASAAAGTELGDTNCDGSVTVSDIGFFVIALVDPAGYAASFPNCDITSADINQDGAVTVSDISGFIDLLAPPPMASFDRIGPTNNVVNDVSADGDVIVGYFASGCSDHIFTYEMDEAFYWTIQDGATGWGFPFDPDCVDEVGNRATAVSADGTVAIGHGRRDTGALCETVVRFTVGGGTSQIWPPNFDFCANGCEFRVTGVTNSGAAIGQSKYETTNKMGNLICIDVAFGPAIPPAVGQLPPTSIALDTTPDGLIQVGSEGGGAVRWQDGIAAQLISPLGTLTAATTISNNGDYIAGSMMTTDGSVGFVVGPDGNVQPLGVAPAGDLIPSGVSDDGLVVVGSAGQTAFIWTPTIGVRDLQDYLQNDVGVGLAGWTLTAATGLSAEGTVIIGNAIKQNETSGWRAFVPRE